MRGGNAPKRMLTQGWWRAKEWDSPAPAAAAATPAPIAAPGLAGLRLALLGSPPMDMRCASGPPDAADGDGAPAAALRYGEAGRWMLRRAEEGGSARCGA